MTIDIILFCYKQEQYIRQALESVLEQEIPADARVRLIVADDHSPDNTLGDIRDVYERQKLHTVSVTLCSKPANKGEMRVADVVEWVFLPEESNMGISKNYKRSFAATEGEYVFILEGDDYWLPGHVMQHVAFLQKQGDVSMCMNRITYLHEDTGTLNAGGEMVMDYRRISLREQIVDGNQLGNLSACCLRGELIRKLPADFFDMVLADWIIGIMLAEKGDIAILNETTSVYRYKDSGWWAGMTPMQQLREVLRDAKVYDSYQNRKYHTYWKEFICKSIKEARRNWMHYMPIWFQEIIHAFTRRQKAK